jgi:acetoin utilization deacetylase AcuC-like enzyme
LTISVHQDRLFPKDSGFVGETGEGPGKGSALNIPLPSGSGNGAYQAVFDDVVLPAIRAFKPDLIMVASGFDAAGFDPLGRMNVTAAGFRAMTAQLVAIADELCDGRLVMSHEGGYSPVYVPYCGLAVLEALAGDWVPHLPLSRQWVPRVSRRGTRG